jgi:hypothetical protein
MLPVAAATTHPNADAELLAACATWHRLTAELMAANEDEDVQAAGERQCAQLHAVSLMPARTPEGIRAKARVLRSVAWQLGPDEGGHIADHTEALIAAVLGEGAP